MNRLTSNREGCTARRAIAALVTALLLTMTSWASACDLACSLAPFHSGCALDGTAMPSGERVSASQNMASDMASDMAMGPNMAMPEEAPAVHTNGQTGAENSPVHLHANSCTHNGCNETSASAISKSVTEHPAHAALVVTAFQQSAMSAIAAQGSWPALEREPNPPPFDPLSISLRI